MYILAKVVKHIQDGPAIIEPLVTKKVMSAFRKS